MFWPFLGTTAIAVGLVQLGMLTVQVLVLKTMLAVAVAVVLLLALALLWCRHNEASAKDQSRSSH